MSARKVSRRSKSHSLVGESGTKTLLRSGAGFDVIPEEDTEHGTSAKGQNHGLTGREREMLKSLAEGLTIEEISARHHISFHTVVSHLRHLYDKLNVHKGSAAVAVARERRII